MARPNRLDDPDFAKAVAELYVAGRSYPEIAEELDCHKDSVRIWVRDPRVRAHTRALSKERVDRISRKIDGEIEGRLNHVSDWDLDDLMRVRKEYLERPLKMLDGTGADEAGATNEIAEAMDNNPEIARALLDMLEGKPQAAPAPAE